MMSEEKKIEDLLKPRYKVIALWLTCSTSMKVGNIIVYDDEFDVFWIDGDAYNPKNVTFYPHLFKPLEWWEDRKPEEMTGYLKCKFFCCIDHVKFDKDEVCKISDVPRGSWDAMNYFLPATKSEYTTYLNNNPK